MMPAEQEIVDRIKQYINANFDGDTHKAFDSYDGDHDGKIDARELVNFLYDVEIGSRFTRWAYAQKIVEALDADKDGEVSWDEFAHHLT